MSYLYIPTSTLNFNNIFSTESISPARFYGERGFGYPQFEPVAPQQYQDAILLYDKYPLFEIDDDGRDHYPMVIKVEESLVKEKNLCEISMLNGITIFSLSETIYFRPDKVEVFFRNEKELKIALIKAEPSLTTKMVSWYKNKLFVFEGVDNPSFKWEADIHQKAKATNRRTMVDSIKNDRRIDRLKGLAYGYILGKCKSIPSSEAKFKAILRELTSQKTELIGSGLEICEPFKEILNEEFYDFVSRCYNRCKEAHTETQLSSHFAVDDDLKLQNLFSEDESQPANKSFIRLVNNFCMNHDFTASLFDSRLVIAKKGGEEIRTIIGSAKWEGSKHKKYINELLNNIKSGKPFDFNSLDSPVLQSFAAFILKGDDLEKLEAYLLDKGIDDLSLSFAFWGGMFGFSKIPKTLFDVLTENDCQYDAMPLLDTSSRGDDSYVVRVYNHIYKELHDKKNICVDTHGQEEVTSVPIDKDFNKLSKELKNKFPSINSSWLSAIQRLKEKFGSPSIANKFKKLQVKKDLGGKSKGVSKEKVTEFLKEYSSYNQDLEPNLPLYPPSACEPKSKRLTFLNDPDVWNIMSEFIPINMRQKVKGDLGWFLKDYTNPNSTCYGYKPSSGKSMASKVLPDERSNKLAIDSFLSLNELKNKIGTDCADLVKKRLLERYED